MERRVRLRVLPGARVLSLAPILLAALLASCGGQPGVTVSIATERIPVALSSTTKSTGWWLTEHGDYSPRPIPLTTIQTSTPVSLHFEAGQGATQIRGWLYDVDSPSPSGGPIEEFTLPGRVGTHEARTIAAGRTYQILVNVKWSGLVIHGEETHVFRVRIEPP